MLTHPHSLFAKALNMQYAIGAFNVVNLETAQAVVEAAAELKAPVIIGTSEGAIEYGGLKQLAAIVKSLAADAAMPVVLHLDHGHSLAQVRQCVEAGYTSVMIDASSQEFAGNEQATREVVEYAHDRKVWVEAELGTILGAEGAKKLSGAGTPEALMTDPAAAKKFIADTGVDALAVSVGTIHGAFTGQEYIRFELLSQIEKMLPNFPLVIHGASGVAPEHLKAAAATNVCKINVDTELRIAFERAAEAYFKQPRDSADIRKLLGPAREAIKLLVKEKIRLFGSSNKA